MSLYDKIRILLQLFFPSEETDFLERGISSYGLCFDKCEIVVLCLVKGIYPMELSEHHSYFKD